MSDSDGPGRREVAHRLFAAEFEDADLSYSESDEERAPNYVVTPSGARVNRLFAVGVLTEVEQVSEDVLRGRVVDPTGAFVLYAGQYQPDEQAFLDRAEPPMFVAVTGKARTFQPDDADTVYTSVRPEMISEVDADTRDRWTVDTAERTLERVGGFAAAARTGERGDALAATLREQGVEEESAEGIALALEHYGTTGTYLAALRDLALDAARVVAGEREEVEPLTADPAAGDDDLLAELAGLADVDAPAGDETAEAHGAEPAAGAEKPADPAEPEESTSAVAAETGGAGSGGVAGDEPGAGDEDSEVGTATPDSAGSGTVTDATATDTDPSTATGGVADDGPAEPAADGTESGAAEAEPVGEFESGAGTDDEVGDFETEEFELDDDEREEIESEYGTDFQSGTEVDEPGEADIETPEPESDTGGTTAGGDADDAGVEPEPSAGAAAGSDADPEPPSEPEPDAEPESEPPTDTGGDDGDAGRDLSGDELEDAVVEVMAELDDGDGVGRETLVEELVERHGVDAADVEDAVQDALMGGRCYEPDDATLKPI
jgi:RPA family protein